MLQNHCWLKHALPSHLVLGQVCILNGSQDHAQQRLLLLWAQCFQGASLEASKQTQVNVAVCQACSRINCSSSGRSMMLVLMYFHGVPEAEGDRNC
jgi:hypothetical protein